MWRLFAKTWSFGCRLVCRPYDYMVYTVYIYIVIYSTYYNLTDVFATLRWFFWESYSDGIQLDLAVQRFAPFVEVRRCKSRHCRLQLCLPGHVFFISTKSRPVRLLCQAIAAIPSTGVEAMWQMFWFFVAFGPSQVIPLDHATSPIACFEKEELFYAISLFICCWCFPLSINVLCFDFDLGAQVKFLEELRCEALQQGILVPHSVKIRVGKLQERDPRLKS